MVKKNFKKIYAKKGYTIRKATVMGNIPQGKTTYKLYLKKGKINIPFPMIKVLNGWYSIFESSGRDDKGEYLVYSKTK